jgi:hypothetical protein
MMLNVKKGDKVELHSGIGKSGDKILGIFEVSKVTKNKVCITAYCGPVEFSRSSGQRIKASAFMGQVNQFIMPAQADCKSSISTK